LEKSELQVKQRENMSKSHLKEMRRAGWVPGSIYGKGKPTIAIEVGVSGIAGILKSESGLHTVVDLKVGGAKKSEGGTAVIKKIQKDPINRRLLHVDFERVSLSDVISSQVSVVPQGNAVGVREGGTLEQLMEQIEVKCRADQMPSHIDVDVSELQLGSFIHAGDISLPTGVELVSRPDDIVIAVRQPHVRKEAGAEETTAEAASEAAE
jgi:large subunit ribosomal protein L25